METMVPYVVQGIPLLNKNTLDILMHSTGDIRH